MKKELKPVSSNQPEERHGISRREMVQKLMGGAAGGLIVPAVAVAHPHSMPPATPALAASAAAEASQPAAGAWTALFLDPHQAETLTVLAERIVPGSTKARVTQFVDLLLSVDTREPQEKFIASLSMMDGESLKRYEAPFKDISEARQNELLTIASAPEHGQPPSNESGSLPGFGAQPGLPLNVLYEHFKNLKSWVSKAYYSSEVGMKELGWDDNYYFPSFPGCEHPT